MQYATCPECHTPQQVVAMRDPARPFAVVPAIERHGAIDLDLCPGSAQPPPAPARLRGGWRVVIETRLDGPIAGPLRIGSYVETQADADEQWLRCGRYRDPHWPSMQGASARHLELLGPDDVADIQRLEAGQLQLAREMDDAHAELRREAGR